MSYEGEVLADTPLAFYRFGEIAESAVLQGEPAADSSGNGLHATYGDSAQMGYHGPVRAAMRCTTAGAAYGAVLPSGLVIPAGSAISVEYWRRLTTATTSRIFTIGEWVTAQGMCGASDTTALVSPSYLYWDYGHTSTANATRLQWAGMADFADGIRWAHIVLTAEDGAAAGTPRARAIYVNGVQVATGSSQYAPLGALAGGSIATRPARVAEFAIYTHALSAARILAHYQAGGGT